MLSQLKLYVCKTDFCNFILASLSSAPPGDDSKLVETEVIGHVLTVAINRPEKRNCVNLLTARQLVDAFDQFEANQDLFVAVLYGKGIY